MYLVKDWNNIQEQLKKFHSKSLHLFTNGMCILDHLFLQILVSRFCVLMFQPFRKCSAELSYL